ncbi:MAG TPA: peptidoglycan editing factor PgeF [Xanthobacteraceae bacterium]|jgi:YfiH family protein|nr:peptidoglycan editing factor PgeF [Xanthobacteraceae bacterium]
MKVQSPALNALSGIRHAFFTRQGGISTGIYTSLNGGLGSHDDPANVTENRRRMAQALGAEALVSCYQIHSADVVIAEKPWTREEAPRADAIVCKTPKLAIGVSIADCGPVLFADHEARVIGCAHSGWKGAFTGVLEATLDKMETLGAKRERVVAAIGPLIRQDSYEVGPEFVARFHEADHKNIRFFAPSDREHHSLFDLPGYIAMRLKKAGVGEIDDLCLDTYSDEERFFSYRRTTHKGEPDYGRLVAAIALLP